MTTTTNGMLNDDLKKKSNAEIIKYLTIITLFSNKIYLKLL